MTEEEKYEMLKNLYSFFDKQNKAEIKFYRVNNKLDKFKGFIRAFESEKNRIETFEEPYSDAKFIYSGKLKSLKIDNKEYSLADLYKEVRTIKIDLKQTNSEWSKAKVIYEKEVNKYAKFYNLKVYDIYSMAIRYSNSQDAIKQKKYDIQKLKEKISLLESELKQLEKGK